VPRCIDSARHARAAASVRATTIATLCDAVHDPLRAILDPSVPVVATGLDVVTDEDPLLPHAPRDAADVELALIDSPLLDGAVDRIRLSIRARYQSHPLASRVPLEVGVDRPVTRGVGAGSAPRPGSARAE